MKIKILIACILTGVLLAVGGASTFACTPSPVPSHTPKITATPRITSTPKITSTPVVTPTPTLTITPSPTVTSTPIVTPKVTDPPVESVYGATYVPSTTPPPTSTDINLDGRSSNIFPILIGVVFILIGLLLINLWNSVDKLLKK